MDELTYSKFKTSIIKKIIRELKQKYIVSDCNGRVIDENEIINNLSKTKKCIGVNSSKTRCSKTVYGNSEYCKSHLAILSSKQVKFTSEIPCIDVEYIYNTNEKIDTRKLLKKFINDTFYYIDIINNYVYTKDGAKVGILGEDEELILTNNPYLLN
jgi:hypothetical protein